MTLTASPPAAGSSSAGSRSSTTSGSRATRTPTSSRTRSSTRCSARRARRPRHPLPPRRGALARRRLARPPADGPRDARRARDQRRRDRDLRAPAAGGAPGRDGAEPDRGGRGAGQRQGDDERGHGVRGPGRGYLLHRGRPPRCESLNSLPAMEFDAPMSLARKIKLGSLGALPDVPFNVRTLASAGVIRPIRPDKLARVARELVRWGASPAAGHRRRRGHPRRRDDDRGRARRDHLRRGPPPVERARPRTRRRRHRAGRRRRDDGPQPPRVRPRDAGSREAGRQRALHEHGLLRPAARRRGRARGARRDHLRRGVRRAPRRGEGGPAPLRLLDRRRRLDRRHPDRRADRFRRRRRPEAAGRVEPLHHPHLGHHRDAEGRSARPAGHAQPAGGDVLADPAAGGGEDGDRGAAVPLLGLRPLQPRAGAELDLRPAAQVRRGEDPAGDRRRAAPPRWSSSR